MSVQAMMFGLIVVVVVMAVGLKVEIEKATDRIVESIRQAKGGEG